MIMLLKSKRRGLNYKISGKLVGVGDSIYDKHESSPHPGGQCLVSLAAALGLTQAGLPAVNQGQMDAAGAAMGSGYTSNPTCVITAVGGGSGAAGVGVACGVAPYVGMITGVNFSALGSGYTGNQSCTFTGGGGTGAVAFLPWDGAGHLKETNVFPNTSGYDGTRSAIGGTTLQNTAGAVGDKGFNFVNLIAARCTNYLTGPGDLVIINLGMNDLAQAGANPTGTTGLNPTNWRRDLQTCLSTIKAHASAPEVVVCGILPTTAAFTVPPWATSIPDAIKQYNAVTMEVASNNDCFYSDMSDFPPAYFSDGIHPSPNVGHPWVYNQLANTIAGRGN